MKILFEGTPLFFNKKVPQAGIAHYVQSIYGELAKLDKTNNYEVFGLNFVGRPTGFKNNFPPKTKFKLIRFIPGKIWNIANRRLALPPLEILLGTKADILIFTQFRLYPSLFAKKRIVFIYDLGFVHFPQHVQSKNRQYLERRVPEAARKADYVVTISEAVKQDIVDTYHIDPEKIIVAHCAVDSSFYKPTKLTQTVRNKYGLPQEYLLFEGTIEPRKNLEKLVQAYDRLPAKIKQQYPLVLAGGKGWNDEAIHAAIKLARANGSGIIQTGFVDDADVPALYTGARALLYPSNFEGFGMQILEAMACHIPVLTGRNSSLPEVGGDAALYVDEQSVDAISKGIVKIIEDEKLRRSLVAKGKQQIQKFSWAKSANKILEILSTD